MTRRIDILVRSNYAHKFGGDVIQVSNYIRHLTPLGYDFAVFPSSPGIVPRRGSLLHVINMDRPFEYLAATEAGVRTKQPLVLSPIHHRTDRIRLLDRNRPSVTGVLARLVRDDALREWMKQLARLHGREARWLFSQPRASVSLATLVRERLNLTTLILALAHGEVESICSDFSFSVSRPVFRVIPNGVDVRTDISLDGQREIDVLMVGRIEERKNQNAVLKVLSRHPGLNVVVAGAMAARSRSYRREFFRLIRAPNVRWMGALDPGALPGLYSSARVVVNASYVEVLSLVELEALAYGCNLIASEHGYTREYVGDLADSIAAEDVSDSLDSLLNKALDKGPNLDAADLVRQRFTWSSVARDLDRCYQAVP